MSCQPPETNRIQPQPNPTKTPTETQAALLGAIAASGLKSLVERVRLETLGRAGLRQLQLDLMYLRPRLLRAAGGGEAVAQLVDEAAAAAGERALEPGALLEPAAVERILAAVQ
jgi:hypothetical protein